MLSDPMFPVIAIVAFASVAGVGWALVGGGQTNQSKKRMKNVAGRANVRGKRQNAALDQASQRRRQVQETLKDLEVNQKKARKRTISLKAQIAQAGLNFSMKTFWIGSAVTGVVLGVFAFALGAQPFVALALLLAGGLGLPRWTVGFLRKRRMKKFSSEFANAIDVIVRGVKAGLPLNECLKIIGNEAPEPVGGEFTELMEGQAMGVSLEDGLRRMYERMPVPELNFFSTVLTIQQKTGGNLAEALGNLSTVIRSRKMMREKIAAFSSEAKASALIIGSLPPGVLALVYVTAPDYMSLMFSENLGRIMLLCGALWMGMGIFSMKKMIDFKI